MCLLSAWAEPASHGIYPPPFIAGGPRNIMCLPSAWAKPASHGIYPPPFTVSGPRNIMCLQRAWAEHSRGIYPPPFTPGGPRVLARAYIHPSSQRMGQGISCTFQAYGPRVPARAYIHTTPLCSGSAQEYHLPSECMGQECFPGDISGPFAAGLLRNIMCL